MRSVNLTRLMFFGILVALAGRDDGATAQLPPLRTVITGAVFIHVVRGGDTLTALGARFGVSDATLARLNQLGATTVLAPGRPLLVDNRHIAELTPGRRLTINVAQRMLYRVEDDRVVGYPVAVGRRSWPTPVGAFVVIDKEEQPTWDVPASIQEEMRRQGRTVITRMAPSPQNPLGAYWLRLSLPGIGIHGTPEPASVYHFASHGCIRMQPADIAALFPTVTVGDTGVIAYRPTLLAAIDGRVYLEVHADEYRRLPPALDGVRAEARALGLSSGVDWTLAARVVRERRGTVVDFTMTGHAASNGSR